MIASISRHLKTPEAMEYLLSGIVGMLRRDLLQKQIEELSRVVAIALEKALILKSDGKITESALLLENVMKTEFDTSLEALINFDIEAFPEKFVKEHNMSTGALEVLADLLLNHQQMVARPLKEIQIKALKIYIYINKIEKTFSAERENKIEQLKKNLSNL